MLILAACASQQTTSVTVGALVQGLTIAEQAAFMYTSLPRCGAGVGLPCSDPAVVAKIKSLDQIAFNAVKTAETEPNLTSAALNAISALSSAIPVGSRK